MSAATSTVAALIFINSKPVDVLGTSPVRVRYCSQSRHAVQLSR
jgi:hypothetical protein